MHRGAVCTYECRFKTRQLTCWSAASICVSLPSFLMDAQRGERKSIIYGVFIWSFMLELKTDEELKRWPDSCRSAFREENKEREICVGMSEIAGTHKSCRFSSAPMKKSFERSCGNPSELMYTLRPACRSFVFVSRISRAPERAGDQSSWHSA